MLQLVLGSATFSTNSLPLFLCQNVCRSNPQLARQHATSDGICWRASTHNSRHSPVRSDYCTVASSTSGRLRLLSATPAVSYLALCFVYMLTYRTQCLPQVNGSILFFLSVSALPKQTATDGVIIDQYSDDTNGRITFKLLFKDNHSDQRSTLVTGLVALIDGFLINTSSSTFPSVVRNIRKDVATEATVLIRGIPLDVLEVSEKHIHECSFQLVELLA